MDPAPKKEQSKNPRMSSLAKRPINISLREVLDRNSFFVVALSLLFAVSFALPLAFALKVGGIMYSGESPEELEPRSDFLPQSPLVTQPNSYVRIKSNPALHPREGQDFLMTFWIRPKKLPALGEREVIMSKVDTESSSRSGYALALQRETGGIKPAFYWRDEKGDGTWFTFSEMEIVPRGWLMLAVSFREGRYLGMHGAVVVEQLTPHLKLLGGYELEKTILPRSESSLMIGSFNQGLFRGEIGPLGIFSAGSISERLEPILEEVLRRPEQLPKQLSKDEIKLWSIDGKSDQSSSANVVEFIRPKRGEK